MKKLQQEVMSEMAQLQSLPAVSQEELAKHNKENDAWVLIDGVVYDVSKFAKFHPGGPAVLLRHCGTDATQKFKMVHHDSVLKKEMYAKFRVGRLALEEMDPKEAKKLLKSKAHEKWLPYGDMYWLDPRGTLISPYYKDKHRKWQKKLRAYFESEVLPLSGKWDEAREYPKDIAKSMFKAEIYAAGYPEEWGGTPPEGGWDQFMSLIQSYELARCGSGGFGAACNGSKAIGLPPVLHHGSEEMKRNVATPVLKADKFISLAITEPWGGSDVAQVRTTAIAEGDYYIVSGEKKFITGGLNADFLTTAVRTDPNRKGMDGISLLLIDAHAPGVERKPIKTQGWWAGTTSYITFDKVKVPKTNLIGKENHGFLYIMENFNQERFGVIMTCVGSCQFMISETIKYARNRYTFGKPLMENQVIRAKFGQMALRTEAVFSFAEQIAYMMDGKIPHGDIAPRIALCKVLSTQTMEFVARECSQIFGGNSYMRGGPGEQVERMYREVRVLAIGGGSEEVMLDFAVRQSKL